MRKGGRGEQLPDLVVRWSDRSSVSLERVVSPRFGTVRRAGAGSGRSGNHTGEGWALVVPGDARMVQLSRPARVVDLAATAVALAGVDPGDLAGVTLLEP
jgi:hypothetical protein